MTSLPIGYFQIKGHSMEPFFKDGARVLINRWAYLLSKPQIGDIVVFKRSQSNKFIIKRIGKVFSNGYFVEGNNQYDSQDSRIFGQIPKAQIIGKVLVRL